jgi:hypothetical protein
MCYTKEFSVDSFEFWGPAVEIVDRFRKAKELDTLQNIIEDTFSDGEHVPTATQINDFVAYDVATEIDNYLST